MAGDRDVAAFGRRARRYDQGWRGRLHHQISDRMAGLALACVPAPRRILDVGCGTGYLLGVLAAHGHVGPMQARSCHGMTLGGGAAGGACGRFSRSPRAARSPASEQAVPVRSFPPG